MPVAVSELNIYPVKSCRGIRVKAATTEDRGFRYDRRWMITDASGRFLTQRELPRLSLIRTSISADSCTLSADGMNSLEIPLEPRRVDHLIVDIWKDSVRALSGGANADAWISKFLQLPARLVFMPDESIRPVNPEYAFNNEQVSFADAFPFLLISEGSLSDLNSRLASPVSMNRFRPNIVVSGCEPYAEDSWEVISIRGVRFRVAKPCSRCTTTTVDQETGVKGEEPLRTLSTYRIHAGNVHFGQNLLHQNRGTIGVGDEVTVIS